MRERGRRRGPVKLLRLSERFAAWREGRTKGARIPERLWKSAAALAVECGVSQTATALKLDYYALKKRMSGLQQQPSVAAPFVEVSPATIALVAECTIELEDGVGASMRMHLKGTEVPDILALGRDFWSGK